MKHALPLAATEESALIVEGAVASALVALLKTAVLRMIPYAVPGLMLVLIDLIVGCQAAKARGEKVRASTAIRRTVTKIFLYLCFLILATTVAIAFERPFLEWGVLGLVYANEFLSVIGNYLETKGMTFSIAGVYRWFIKWIAGKAGADMSDDEATDILKNKNRNKKKAKDETGGN